MPTHVGQGFSANEKSQPNEYVIYDKGLVRLTRVFFALPQYRLMENSTWVCLAPQIVSDGKIIGNIQAERVRLRRSAIVVGNVTCLSLSLDPDVSISGKLNVHKDAPLKLHLEGEEAPENEVESVRLPDSNKSVDSEKHHSKSGGGSGRKEGSSKKDSGGGDGERRQKEDKGKDKDDSRKKNKEGGSGESTKSKTSSK